MALLAGSGQRRPDSFCDLRGPGGLYSTPRYFLPRQKRVMARILVIDDDPAILQTMERVLARDSHLVEAYADARKALDALRRERPDLVITDLFMPEMDGIEFLLSLREAETNLPVIVTSGGGATSAHHLLTDAGYLGATATIAKPFKIDELLELVRSVLEG